MSLYWLCSVVWFLAVLAAVAPEVLSWPRANLIARPKYLMWRLTVTVAVPTVGASLASVLAPSAEMLEVSFHNSWGLVGYALGIAIALFLPRVSEAGRMLSQWAGDDLVIAAALSAVSAILVLWSMETLGFDGYLKTVLFGCFQGIVMSILVCGTLYAWLEAVDRLTSAA